MSFFGCFVFKGFALSQLGHNVLKLQVDPDISSLDWYITRAAILARRQLAGNGLCRGKATKPSSLLGGFYFSASAESSENWAANLTHFCGFHFI